MLLNIKTGYGGVRKRENEEIVIIVSSIDLWVQNNVRFLISDRHAYIDYAEFSDNKAGLAKIDFDLLRSKNFKRDPERPDKFDKYQAEALARSHVPVDAILELVCCNPTQVARLQSIVMPHHPNLDVTCKPHWYF